jgi:ribonucleoside-diphosphate reductase alpha chain
MDVWDAMCRTIMSAGSRRGAMMAVMRCDHPDIIDFIEAKRQPGRLRMFNLSVLVTDAFMQAVKEDARWDLVFGGTVYRSLPARDLWDRIMRATFAYAEPGVIFIDRINALNPLNYAETIHATNPCGEQPLPPYGACLLGSVNLARLVMNPFTADAAIDAEALSQLVAVAVRMLDNAIDASRFPLDEQVREAQAKRRIGLGVTGLADALIMCGARYGSAQARLLVERWMMAIRRAAYLASTELAAEKGAFPLLDREAYLGGEGTQTLDQDVREAIAEKGLRNALLTSVAPTGTISLFADNVSSGLEPVFSFTYRRHVLMPDGTRRDEEVSDYAYRLYRRLKGPNAPLTDAFVDAQGLSPRDHLVMQAAIQKYVDSSISKTINVPEAIAFDDFKGIYEEAYALGCKGCTTYRPNEITGAVLETGDKAAALQQPELPLGRPSAAATARPKDLGDAGNLVHLMQPLSRPEALQGATYKLQWPESDHALYITVNDIVQDGRRRPFEVFINSKNTEHYAWTVALTRMISAVFRRGGDVAFVVEELKAVFDPRGGQWMRGKYVPSLLAAIGEVLESHMVAIGFLPAPGREAERAVLRQQQVVNLNAPSVEHDHGENADLRFRQCPKCGQASLIRQEGCDTCTSCAYSKCG